MLILVFKFFIFLREKVFLINNSIFKHFRIIIKALYIFGARVRVFFKVFLDHEVSIAPHQ